MSGTSQPQNFPQLTSPFVGPDRIITQPWYRFLTTLWLRTGGNQNVIIPAGSEEYTWTGLSESDDSSISTPSSPLAGILFDDQDAQRSSSIEPGDLLYQEDAPRSGIDPSSLLFQDPEDRYRAPSETAVTVGVSPFVYQATRNGNVLILGGTVSKIEWARSAGYYDPGFITGFVPVALGDLVRVTYTVAPTMLLIPSA